MMKFRLILALTMLLSLSTTAFPEEKRLDIVAVNFPAFDFSRVIAGDRAEVRMLLPPGAEAHSYEPSPKDIITIQQADLLVYNGGIADYWMDGVLEALGSLAPEAFKMMDSVTAVEEELAEGMEDVPHGRGEGDAHEGDTDARDLDEHVWTSPHNAALIAKGIAEKLSELDPAGRGAYEARLKAYTIELDSLDLAFRELVSGSKRRTIVLGDRFPMRYFTMEYGLSYYAAFPGCSAQTEPSARTLAFLMNKIREEGIPVVFYIEFNSGRSAGVIAAETGAKPLLLHSAHNVTLEELEAGVSYLSLMRGNIQALREALN